MVNATNIFLWPMIDSSVRVADMAKPIISHSLICADCCANLDVIENDIFERDCLHIFYRRSADISIALDNTHYDSFIRSLFAFFLYGLTATNTRFIYLDVSAELAADVSGCHQLSKFMGHAPCTLVGDAYLT